MVSEFQDGVALKTEMSKRDCQHTLYPLSSLASCFLQAIDPDRWPDIAAQFPDGAADIWCVTKTAAMEALLAKHTRAQTRPISVLLPWETAACLSLWGRLRELSIRSWCLVDTEHPKLEIQCACRGCQTVSNNNELFEELFCIFFFQSVVCRFFKTTLTLSSDC